MSQEVFKVQGASKRFGGLQALSDVSLSIHEGQVYGLIGPNGAGKTTFFNVITGLYTPDSGSFELAGKPYEPSASAEPAAWEAKEAAATSTGSGLSRFIKPKRKVAALLGGTGTTRR